MPRVVAVVFPSISRKCPALLALLPSTFPMQSSAFVSLSQPCSTYRGLRLPTREAVSWKRRRKVRRTECKTGRAGERRRARLRYI